MGFGSTNTIQNLRFLRVPREVDPATQVVPVANRAFLAPIFIPRLSRLDTIMLRVINFSGQNMLAGIYADNTDTPTGGNLLVSSGPVNLQNPPLNVNNPVMFTINQQLVQGLYWLVYMFDSAGGGLAFYRTLAFDILPAPFNGCLYDNPNSFSLLNPCPAVTADNSISPDGLVRVAQVYE